MIQKGSISLERIARAINEAVAEDHEVPLSLEVGGVKELRRTQFKRRLIAFEGERALKHQ